jgi:predicted O-linked N-acetylglucosamine transferase (SPINDLY family)
MKSFINKLLKKDSKENEFIEEIKPIEINLSESLIKKEEGDNWIAKGNNISAEKCYLEAIDINPCLVDAYIHLAWVIGQKGRLVEAEKYLLIAVGLDPNNFESFQMLGQGAEVMGDNTKAAYYLKQAIKINPKLEGVWPSLARVLFKSGKSEEAKTTILEGIDLFPKNPEMKYYLAGFYHQENKLTEALKYYLESLSLKPDSSVLNNNIGNTFVDLGNPIEAVGYYKKAAKDESNMASLFSISSLLFSMYYLPGFKFEDYENYKKKYGEMISRGVKPYTVWNSSLGKNNQKIRLGFVSGDLREHAVAYFLEGLLKNIDKEKFELIAFYNHFEKDKTNQRIKGYFNDWNEVYQKSEEKVAEMIHGKNIDILIDLSGHTTKHMLKVFAYKPAPIQVTWLGYFGSTGVKEIDYILADENCLMSSEYKWFTEKVINLPNTRLCFTPPIEGDKNYPTTSPYGRNKFLTFGCYQALSKINDEVISLWGKIFEKMPEAKLRIQNKQMLEIHARENIMARIKKVGIKEENISLVGFMERSKYLDSYSEVDILLDTFPYTGGTTTCEALWMGVPSITLSGNNMIARQGATFLSCVGLNDWVAKSKEEYVSKAIDFAKDITCLNNIRGSLRERMLASPLTDEKLFTKNFEKVLLKMLD